VSPAGRRLVHGLVLSTALAACAGAPIRVAALDDVERARVASGAREGAALAPEAFAHAEAERGFAHDAHAAGDDVGAALHAQRALAACGIRDAMMSMRGLRR